MILRRALQHARHSEDGSILALFAIVMALFFGIIALSFDFGRTASTQSEMQSFADNVALAAAGELTGDSSAISRARLAATTLITDTQAFGDGGANLDASDFTLTFYADNPASGGSPTEDPSLASFVTVDAAPRQVSAVFGAAFAALSGTGVDGAQGVAARATAGHDRFACDITPLMICAPAAGIDVNASIGSALTLDASVSTGNLVPGVIAALQPVDTIVPVTDPICAGLSGLGLDLCQIASEGPKASCYPDTDARTPDNLLELEIDSALNVRFDIFGGAATGLINNPIYPAAPNVLSGFEPSSGQCIGSNPQQSATLIGLPGDDCHSAGSCGISGNGDWSLGRQAYIDANYGGTDPYPEARTRYDFYLAEIAAAGAASTNNNGLLGGLGGLGSGLGGLGSVLPDLTDAILPSCSSEISTDPARRVIVTAFVDCSGAGLNASVETLPIIDYAEVFLLSPAGLNSSANLQVEILGGLSEDPDDNVTNGRMRSVVRLFE